MATEEKCRINNPMTWYTNVGTVSSYYVLMLLHVELIFIGLKFSNLNIKLAINLKSRIETSMKNYSLILFTS